MESERANHSLAPLAFLLFAEFAPIDSIRYYASPHRYWSSPPRSAQSTCHPDYTLRHASRSRTASLVQHPIAGASQNSSIGDRVGVDRRGSGVAADRLPLLATGFGAATITETSKPIRRSGSRSRNLRARPQGATHGLPPLQPPRRKPKLIFFLEDFAENAVADS